MQPVYGSVLADPPLVPHGTKVVKVFVGSEEKEFVVHKDILCACSRFFERAFDGGFVEGKLQELRLPEEQAELFAVFIDWLYGGCDHQKFRSSIQARQQWHVDEVDLKLYRMADRLMIPGLQLLAIHRLRNIFTHHQATLPSREFLHSLYSEEAPPAIRVYIVEHVAYWLPMSPNQEQLAQLTTAHHKFDAEMAVALVRSRSTLLPHPYTVAMFDGSRGLDLEVLQKEARAADQRIEGGGMKDLDRLPLY
jgi:hypothetical protein